MFGPGFSGCEIPRTSSARRITLLARQCDAARTTSPSEATGDMFSLIENRGTVFIGSGAVM